MKTTANYATLTNRPEQFFMSVRDISFWIQSARADATLARLEHKQGIQSAFNQLYGANADPWGFTNPRYRYQRLKYEKLLSVLPARSYASALDVGCGIGVFARSLAPYVGAITGVEIAAEAVEQARILSQDVPNVRYFQRDLLTLNAAFEADALGRFDLIALVDVLYYLSPLTDERLKTVIASLEALLQPGGIVLLANHYFFGLDSQSRLVQEIHSAFRWSKPLRLLHEEKQPFFLASVFQKE